MEPERSNQMSERTAEKAVAFSEPEPEPRLDISSCHILQLSKEYTLIGKSVAAQGTAFHLRELGILFDAGQDLDSNTTNIQLILITHKDADHIKCICSHILNSNQKPIIYCPNSMKEQLEWFITCFFRMTNSSDYDTFSNYCSIVGIEANQTFIYEPNRSSKWGITSYECFHGYVPCLAYGITRITKGLKEEYKGLSSEEIVCLRKKSIEINEDRYTPILFYATDTTIKIFENTDIFKFPKIMCECTLLYPEQPLGKKKHIHWEQLQNVVKDHPENEFILFHFSEQYREKQIKEFFDEVELPNVRPYFI